MFWHSYLFKTHFSTLVPPNKYTRKQSARSSTLPLSQRNWILDSSTLALEIVEKESAMSILSFLLCVSTVNLFYLFLQVVLRWTLSSFYVIGDLIMCGFKVCMFSVSQNKSTLFISLLDDLFRTFTSEQEKASCQFPRHSYTGTLITAGEMIIGVTTLENSLTVPCKVKEITPHISRNKQCVFCDWLISHSVISSRFTHVVAYDSISFFLKAE